MDSKMLRKHCCLCFTACNNCILIQNEVGESTEVYDVTVKYFDPMVLIDDRTATINTTAKVLCNECWSHINAFHEFQQTVLKNRAMYCGSIDQKVQEMIVLPRDDKDFFSEDDFSDKEAIDFDSDFDDVALKKLFKKEKLFIPDRPKAARDKSDLFDAIGDVSMPDVDTYDINTGTAAVMPVLKKEERDEEQLIAIDVEFVPDIDDDCNENELSDMISGRDDVKNTVEITIEKDFNTESEDLEITDDCNLANSSLNDDIVIDNGNERKRKTSKVKYRNRLVKSDVVASSESESSTTVLKGALAAKDSSRAVYTLEKGRESDTFIAQWKPSLECDLCPATATNFDMLRSHFREVHKNRFYIKCCDRKFYRRCILVDHIRLHVNPETHKCDICGKSSTSKYNLKLHKKIVHNEVREFECEICHKNFNHKPTLDRHLLTHVKGDKEFFCKECGKGYVLEVQLNTHMRNVHNGLRICEQCGKTFHSVGALKKHLIEHGNFPQPKYPCEACGVELKSNEALKRHKAAYHHDGSTVYVCSVCGKVAASEHALLSHKKFVHEDKRKHKCSLCDKAFRTAIVLREHIATHTGEDLYQCRHCPQTFKTNANMHHHRKRVHPVEWKEARKNRLNLPKVNVDQLRRQVIL